MLFFWLWQTDNESIQKCPPRYFSGGLDDRIAFASDDPPLKNGWNFKVVKVPGYLRGLVSLLNFPFRQACALSAVLGRTSRQKSLRSPSYQLQCQFPIRSHGAKQAKSDWNLIMAASLEFIEAAAPGLDAGTAAKEALRWICL